MDFSLIKDKLKGFRYKGLQEFLDDVLLVFSNCILYNGEQNQYG